MQTWQAPRRRRSGSAASGAAGLATVGSERLIASRDGRGGGPTARRRAARSPPAGLLILRPHGCENAIELLATAGAEMAAGLDLVSQLEVRLRAGIELRPRRQA